MAELIDDRGRLFGRLNIVDALVILLSIAVVTAGLAVVSDSPVLPLVAIIGGLLLTAGAALYGSDSTPQNTSETTWQFTVEATDLHPAVADTISSGDTTQDGLLTVVAVHDDPTAVVVQTGDGELRSCDHPHRRTVTITVRWDSQLEAATFRGERLYIGRSIALVFERTQLEGTIISIDDKS